MKPLLITLAILPGILICLYIYRMDKYEKESRWALIVCFILGMLAALPLRSLHQWSAFLGWDAPSSLPLTLFSSFILVALSEELLKFFVLIAFPYQRTFFNEPFDGIVYAVMISMGFATLENILYAERHELTTIILRAFTAVPAHGVFGVIMGYYAGRAKFSPGNSLRLLLTGLGLAIALHGLYDFFILQEAYEWLVIFAILTLAISLYFANNLIKEHQKNSPFRNDE
jgi:protease PrsW